MCVGAIAFYWLSVCVCVCVWMCCSTPLPPMTQTNDSNQWHKSMTWTNNSTSSEDKSTLSYHYNSARSPFTANIIYTPNNNKQLLPFQSPLLTSWPIITSTIPSSQGSVTSILDCCCFLKYIQVSKPGTRYFLCDLIRVTSYLFFIRR